MNEMFVNHQRDWFEPKINTAFDIGWEIVEMEISKFKYVWFMHLLVEFSINNCN